MNKTDVEHLRRCIELARAARADGNEPFGSLLVGGDGSVLIELTNTTGDGDVTGHPELALAAWASVHLTVDQRASATLYRGNVVVAFEGPCDELRDDAARRVRRLLDLTSPGSAVRRQRKPWRRRDRKATAPMTGGK